MNLRELFAENISRTGESKSAVVGWGRGMGHKGHMYLADAVITQAEETGADPYFVVSRTIGKDDPITPEEKLYLYKKVFPKMEHIFHAASDELPDLNRVLKHLASLGYTDVTVVVGADQKNAFQYLVRPDKSGVEPYKQFGFNSMNVISRQETSSKHSHEEGPRATPMRQDLLDPAKNDDAKFKTWRDAMSPEISDDEVRDLMAKAHARMIDPTFGKKPKKPVSVKEANSAIRESKKPSKLRQNQLDAGHGVVRMRDNGGYDRIYHLNRMMMAMAMADGLSTEPVDSQADTWFEKFNTGHPYTKEEYNKLLAAMNTIPTIGNVVLPYRKSTEPSKVNVVSPVAQPKKNKYGI